MVFNSKEGLTVQHQNGVRSAVSGQEVGRVPTSVFLQCDDPPLYRIAQEQIGELRLIGGEDGKDGEPLVALREFGEC
jgi:hypothetical protein